MDFWRLVGSPRHGMHRYANGWFTTLRPYIGMPTAYPWTDLPGTDLPGTDLPGTDLPDHRPTRGRCCHHPHKVYDSFVRVLRCNMRWRYFIRRWRLRGLSRGVSVSRHARIIGASFFRHSGFSYVSYFPNRKFDNLNWLLIVSLSSNHGSMTNRAGPDCPCIRSRNFSSTPHPISVDGPYHHGE